MVPEISSTADKIFCYFGPFFALKTQKIKILKKRKKLLEILSFYTSVPKVMIICYTAPNSGQNKGQKSEITCRILNLPAGKNEKLLAQKQYFIRFYKTEISKTFQTFH